MPLALYPLVGFEFMKLGRVGCGDILHIVTCNVLEFCPKGLNDCH